MLTPHHLGRSGEVNPFEIGKELVLLPLVVNLDSFELLQLFLELLRSCSARYLPQQRTDLLQHLSDRFIFFEVGMHRMPRQHPGLPLAPQGLLEYLDMNIADLLHLFHGNSLGNQGLLHLGNLLRADVADQFGKPLSHSLDIASLVEILYDLFEPFLPIFRTSLLILTHE